MLMLYIVTRVDWEFCEKGILSTMQLIFRKLLCGITYFRSSRVKNSSYNVLTLGCLGCVEPNIIMIVPFKPLMQLRFGFGIMP